MLFIWVRKCQQNRCAILRSSAVHMCDGKNAAIHYTTGHLETAASQNGFHKLSLNKKTKINKKMTNIKFLSNLSFIIEQSYEGSLLGTFVE